MENEKILDRKKKIALKKARLERKEKSLMEMERKLRIRKLIELGSLVSKAGIEEMDIDTLFGSFLEIKEKSTNENVLKAWNEKGSQAFTFNKKNRLQRLIISFREDPPQETKNVLRDMRFRWYAFRREWYGIGKKEEIDQLLGNVNANVEILKD